MHADGNMFLEPQLVHISSTLLAIYPGCVSFIHKELTIPIFDGRKASQQVEIKSGCKLIAYLEKSPFRSGLAL